MSLRTPTNINVKNGDGCAFITWSTVPNATMYEIQIKNQKTWLSEMSRTSINYFVQMNLINGQCYIVQIKAINEKSISPPSSDVKIRPRACQCLFDFSAKRIGNSCQIRLKWTAIPTNVGYHIERCDIGHANKYFTINNITDNNVSTITDQTSCDMTKLQCAGHFYKISASDAPWLPNGSKSTAMVLCIKQSQLTVSAQPITSVVSTAALSLPTASTAKPVVDAKDMGLVEKMQLLIGMRREVMPGIKNKSDTENSTAHATVSVTPQTDIIVVCSSSEYLFNAICKAGGDFFKASYDTQLKQNPDSCIIAVKAEGQLASKMVYFLPWKKDSDALLLHKSFEKFVSDAVEKAVLEKYQSIVFPAIGCGKFGCSITIVAQAMVGEAHRMFQKYPISISFIIQPERTDIYDEFKKKLNALQSSQSFTLQQPIISTSSVSAPQQPIISASSVSAPPPPIEPVKTITLAVNKGTIEVEKGDITAQKVDVIIGSSSSQILKQAIIKVAGDHVNKSYNDECKNNSNAILISTPPGNLPCKRIFFVKWEPNRDEQILRQSLTDLIWTVIQNVLSYNFTSFAFPALGCGQHACSVDVVVKTMVKEVKNQLTMRNTPLAVKFIIQPNQQNIYDEFCKQVLATKDGDIRESFDYQRPMAWEKSNEKKIRFELSNTTDEYKSISTNFDQVMKGKYTQIIRIERVQNERWYIQYFAHSQHFKARLSTDTEKYLYHGCPDNAANAIMDDCFNRSFAGVNGTAYGVGVYFSSNAAYSHTYTKPNGIGERNMFLARVLVGNTTKGNGSMKTRPIGFDSTTDGSHIFVTYHDAQAYADYLITYKRHENGLEAELKYYKKDINIMAQDNKNQLD
ncbi:unnamed protein product [Adineta steineri]|uniref:Poly [ADP-ribose] polymerase n=1 Tax=Adineta steineri TaxID=433720 RepID=A0A814V3Z9_9BILA|nr:unnamed protein product [Adineta steineri]CAF1184937.1 unnamed protein product [Adineta steineri]